MEKILEKSVKTYVIAGIDDNYCWYIASKHTSIPNSIAGRTEYFTTTDIAVAAKAQSRKIAKLVRDDYIKLTGDSGLDLVIIPLVTDYSLVKEVADE